LLVKSKLLLVLLGLNLKIRHDAIVDNIVTNLLAKFDDDRLRNEKALVGLLLITTTTGTTLVALWDPFPGPKNTGGVRSL